VRAESTEVHPQRPVVTYRPSMSRSRSLRRSALAFAALATISLAACGDDDGGGSTDSTSAPTATTEAPSGATTAPTGGDATGEVVVVIKDVAFQTPEVTVKAGGSVMWDNQDNQAHTATGTGSFATDTIAPGESKTVTFDEAGTFPYICSFHPFMKGTVTVE
jgi:plastocyanin